MKQISTEDLQTINIEQKDNTKLCISVHNIEMCIIKLTLVFC